MTKQPKISIAIPVHAMDNWEFFLTRCLDSIVEQGFQDYEVVVTDNSPEANIGKLLQTYAMPIRHYFNTRVGMAQNTNEAISKSTGQYIKILYMDDYFADSFALQDIADDCEPAGAVIDWLITPSDNNKKPRYTEDIHLGNNKLGSPSALTMRRESALLFDEQMTWLLDCDLYKRLYERFGEPVIQDRVGIKIGVHDGQMSNLLTDGEKELEQRYMINKYND